MSNETSTTERPQIKERVAKIATPSSSAVFQEGTKIQNGKPLSLTETVHQLMLPASPTINEASLKIPNIDALTNNKKIKLVLYSSTHDALTSKNSHAEQALSFLIAEPELRTDIIVSTKKERTPGDALQADSDFVRESAGVAVAKLVSSKKVTQEQGVSFALAFKALGHDLSALQKTQIINSLINPSVNPLPLELVSAARSVSEISRIYSDIYKSILSTLSVRDRNSNLLSYSSFAGSAQTLRAILALCSDKDRIFEYFGTEKRAEHVPHEIDSLPKIVEIVQNNPLITTVSFDLYDTLVQWTSNQDERRGQMDKLATFLLRKKYGISISLDRFTEVSRKAWDKRWNKHQGKGKEIDIRETLGWMVDDVGSIKDPIRRREAIDDLEKLWYKVELDTSARMPEAEATLKRLREMGKKICLTSNASWSEAHVRRVLKRFGLEEYFDAVSISNENGKMKHPTKADFFHFSWGKVKAKPEEVLHVGDNQWADFDGARFAGAKATRYSNPNSFAEIETNAYYWENPTEYAKRAYEFFTKQQNREALSMISRLLEQKGIPEDERERVTVMAKEVYQKTRDVIGPAYVALSDQLLTRLSNGESDLVLSLARDGLPFAVAQKLLLYLEPDRYPGADPKQVRYIHASRKFLDRFEADQAFRDRYTTFLEQHGAGNAQKIDLVDLLCGSGKTHEGIKKALGNKKVEGFYMDSHQTARLSDTHSFLKDNLAPNADLSSENMLLLFEAMFSGPYESAIDIDTTSHGLAPTLKRKTLSDEVLIRGLSEQSLLLMNHLAIVGIQDAARSLHRRRLLSMTDMTKAEIMKRFYAFISAQPPPIWQDIWRSTPWQDYGKWYLPEQNHIEDGVKAGKI